jgi:hypothetical protein
VLLIWPLTLSSDWFLFNCVQLCKASFILASISLLCFEDSPYRYIAIFCFEDKASKSIVNSVLKTDRPTTGPIEAPSRSLKNRGS